MEHAQAIMALQAAYFEMGMYEWAFVPLHSDFHRVCMAMSQPFAALQLQAKAGLYESKKKQAQGSEHQQPTNYNEDHKQDVIIYMMPSS